VSEGTSTPVINLLTIDVEDWFHTSALERYVPPEAWDRLPSTLVDNVHFLLDFLDDQNTRATFFILGWVAERHPELVKKIDAWGHEIASHGYRHRLIYNLSRETFREYINRAKAVLEDLLGRSVQGYRATSFSVVKSTLWALDVIKEAGFTYDSSISPIRHDIYGIADCPRFPFIHPNGLVEIPASTVKLWGRNFPLGGGGFFRLYPYWLTRKGIESINRRGYPVVVYLHPWELDPHCPKISQADWRTQVRQYLNLAKTKKRLKNLLSHFSFGPIQEYLQTVEFLRSQDLI
jgi:polysaccharide deacetylase family protein (PEP-CTERM system associated)